jgi:hypothetical protein
MRAVNMCSEQAPTALFQFGRQNVLSLVDSTREKFKPEAFFSY